jgi:hypothetical protein
MEEMQRKGVVDVEGLAMPALLAAAWGAPSLASD